MYVLLILTRERDARPPARRAPTDAGTKKRPIRTRMWDDQGKLRVRTGFCNYVLPGRAVPGSVPRSRTRTRVAYSRLCAKK